MPSGRVAEAINASFASFNGFRNARPRYIEAFWNLVDWDRVAARSSPRTR